MSGLFHWYLLCGACGDIFQPDEEDWDGDITCQHCREIGRICHDEDGGEVLEVVNASVDWPLDLSDEQLDAAWTMSGLLSDDQLKKLRDEYERRGKVIPRSNVGQA